jgi:hypothetical protein
MKIYFQKHIFYARKLTMSALVVLTLFLGFQNITIAQANSWIYNPNNGHYYFVTEPMDWFSAEAEAQVLGGHLVTLNNADEEEWIKDTFGRYEHFWIGFSDTIEEGVWVWSSGEQVDYTNWDLGEPNNCCFCTEYPGCEDAAVMNWQAETGSGTFGDYWNDLAPDGLARGIVEFSKVQVDIDIKPGSYPNCFNINGSGVIPVAILGSSDFDVTNINPATLLFNGSSVQVRGKKEKTMCHYEDVSGDFTYPEGAPDGLLDLVCQFEDDPSQWLPGQAEATVIGELTDGTPIEGTDSVCIVP